MSENHANNAITQPRDSSFSQNAGGIDQNLQLLAIILEIVQGRDIVTTDLALAGHCADFHLQIM